MSRKLLKPLTFDHHTTKWIANLSSTSKFYLSSSQITLIKAMKAINAYFITIIVSIFHITCADTNTVIIPITKDRTTLQYIAKLQQGTPPKPVSFTIDLGGPFSWVDCTHQYKSSTYGPAQCGLAPCASFGPDQTCNNCTSGLNPSPGCNNNTCSVIAFNPVTGKSLTGEVASDILTVHSTDGPNIGPLVTAHADFVCGATSLLQGLSKGVNGVVGFGRDRSSLLAQFDGEFSDEVFFFPLKFTVCLSSTSGFAIFGKADYLSKLLKFTPMIQNLKGIRSTDYYVNMTSIKINGKEVDLNTSLLSMDNQGNGGTKISTVHPYTVLEGSIFKAVSDAFTKQFKGAKRVRPVNPFGACYEVKGLSVSAIDLVMHKKSVYWRILGPNLMVRVNRNVSCLGFVDGGVDSRVGVVVGGYQLEDNLVEFSGVDGIGFSSSLLSKGTSCANFNFTT